MNYISHYEKEVRYHKGGVSLCEADGYWLGKTKGEGVLSRSAFSEIV